MGGVATVWCGVVADQQHYAATADGAGRQVRLSEEQGSHGCCHLLPGHEEEKYLVGTVQVCVFVHDTGRCVYLRQNS